MGGGLLTPLYGGGALGAASRGADPDHADSSCWAAAAAAAQRITHRVRHRSWAAARALHRGGICAAEVVHRAAVSSDPAARERDSRVTSEVKKESGGVRVLPVVAADRDGHRLGSALGGQQVLFALLRRQPAPHPVGLGHSQRMVAAVGDHQAAVAHGFGVGIATPPVLTPLEVGGGRTR